MAGKEFSQPPRAPREIPVLGPRLSSPPSQTFFDAQASATTSKHAELYLKLADASPQGRHDALEPSPRPSNARWTPTSPTAPPGPLFLDDHGRRMYEAQAWRLVRRLARHASLKSTGQLSPHSLRHIFATSLSDAVVPLQDIQDAMGHADPRTTRRYTYAFAAWLRRTPRGD